MAHPPDSQHLSESATHRLDGSHAQAELAGDLGVALTAREQYEYLQVTFG